MYKNSIDKLRINSFKKMIFVTEILNYDLFLKDKTSFIKVKYW